MRHNHKNHISESLCRSVFGFLSKLSEQKFHNYLACEFTALHACSNAEMNLKSSTTNGFNFRIINSLMESWRVRLTWLDCNNGKKPTHIQVRREYSKLGRSFYLLEEQVRSQQSKLVNSCDISQSLSLFSGLKLQVTHQVQSVFSRTLTSKTILWSGQPTGTGCSLQNGFPFRSLIETFRAVGTK